MADKSVAQEVRETIASRLKEIRSQVDPLITEESELVQMSPGEKIHFAQHSDEPEVAPAESRSVQPEAPAAAAKPRRKRAGGTRADQAVDHIAKNPGISASEIASAMKIKPNYLYRVLGELEKEGRLVKDGRSYTVAA